MCVSIQHTCESHESDFVRVCAVIPCNHVHAVGVYFPAAAAAAAAANLAVAIGVQHTWCQKCFNHTARAAASVVPACAAASVVPAAAAAAAVCAVAVGVQHIWCGKRLDCVVW